MKLGPLFETIEKADGLLGHFPARIRNVLDCIEIAEDMLVRARLPRSHFAALCPSAQLIGRTPFLYAAHARELCRRINVGEPLEPATDAELLSVMLATAGVAPLNAEGQAVAEQLFARVFPEKVKDLLGEPVREKWAGQVEEQIGALRRKFSQRRGGA